MNRFFLIFLFVFIIVFLFFGFWWNKRSGSSLISKEADSLLIKINDWQAEVEIANTPLKRINGLSERKEIQEDQGMLFVFAKPDYYAIWMKKMNFPLDIIWLDENLRIVEIKNNIKPDSWPQSFASSLPAQYILELKSGVGEKYNFQKQDQLILNHK
jgi:hypothetical protein